MSEFQRARQPDQVDLRRQTLLAAAGDLFDAEGPSGAALTAIAERAGFTKSNVYRYFESREHLLLALLEAEWDRLSDALETAIQRVPANDTPELAHVVTTCFLAQPRCCQLMSIFASTLERNVSEVTIEAVKRHFRTVAQHIVACLLTRMPAATADDCAWVFSTICTYIAGLWPGVRPAPAAAAVLAKPEFADMRVVPEREIERVITALLTSIVPAQLALR